MYNYFMLVKEIDGCLVLPFLVIGFLSNVYCSPCMALLDYYVACLELSHGGKPRQFETIAGDMLRYIMSSALWSVSLLSFY